MKNKLNTWQTVFSAGNCQRISSRCWHQLYAPMITNPLTQDRQVTNLFHIGQAEEMVRYLVDGLPE